MKRYHPGLRAGWVGCALLLLGFQGSEGQQAIPAVSLDEAVARALVWSPALAQSENGVLGGGTDPPDQSRVLRPLGECQYLHFQGEQHPLRPEPEPERDGELGEATPWG